MNQKNDLFVSRSGAGVPTPGTNPTGSPASPIEGEAEQLVGVSLDTKNTLRLPHGKPIIMLVGPVNAGKNRDSR